MDKILGLDGGGTKTDVAVIDRAGTVLDSRRTDGLDPTPGSQWEAVLADIATSLGPVTTAVLGLPYHGDVSEISARQAAVAASLFGANSVMVNDVAVAFAGALAGSDGVLVLAGKGSMAWARGPLGEHRVGGWGSVFDDEGSAYAIGKAALARISRQLDGRSMQTAFANTILAQLDIKSGGLIEWTYNLQDQRAGIAAVARLVSNLAQAGDCDALVLMAEAGQHLADLGQTAARLCGTSTRWSNAGGGVMNDQTVRDTLTMGIGSTPIPPYCPRSAVRFCGGKSGGVAYRARSCRPPATDPRADTSGGPQFVRHNVARCRNIFLITAAGIRVGNGEKQL